MRILFVFLMTTFFYASSITAQRLSFDGEILSMAKAPGTGDIVITTPDSMYFIRQSTAEISRRVAHGLKNPVIQGFHPYYFDLVFLREFTRDIPEVYSANTGIRAFMDRISSYEYVKDSMVMYNPVNQSVKKFGGNNYFSFGAGENKLVMIENQLFRLKDSTGHSPYSSSSSQIQTVDGDFKFSSSINKSCRRLISNDSFTLAAAAWYDLRSKWPNNHSFSIFNLRTHQPIFELDSLEAPCDQFVFSPDGARLAVAYAGKDKKAHIRIINLADMKTSEVAFDDDYSVERIGSLQFSFDYQHLYYLANNNWYSWDIYQQLADQTLWSNLSNVFWIQDAIYLRGYLWTTGDEQSRLTGGKKTASSLNKINVKDYSVFTTIERESVNYYADSTQYQMQLNDFQPSNRNLSVHFNSSREFVATVMDKRLQYWDVKRRKKILEQDFSEDIVASPDKAGKFILVRELVRQSNYSEYMFRLFQSHNGSIYSSAILKPGKDKPDASSYYFRLIPHPTKDQTWLAIDGSSTLWQINGSQFTCTRIVQMKEGEISDVLIGKNNRILLSSVKENETSVWILGEGNKLQRWVSGDQLYNLLAVAGNRCWGAKQYDSCIYVYNQGVFEKKITFPGKVEYLDYLPNEEGVLVTYQSRNSSRLHACEYKEDRFVREEITEKFSGDFFLLNNSRYLYAKNDEGLVTFNQGYAVNWSILAPRTFLNTFNLSNDGHEFSYGNMIMNLDDLSTVQLEQYSKYARLPDKSGRVEISGNRYATNKKELGFTIFLIRERDTVKAKTFVTITNTTSYAAFHDQVVISPDGKYAITYSKTASFFSNEDYTPAIIWNLHTMTGMSMSIRKVEFVQFVDNNRVLMNQDKAITVGERPGQSLYSLSTGKLLNEYVFDWTHHIQFPQTGIVPRGRGVQWLKKEDGQLKTLKDFYSKTDIDLVNYYAPSNTVIGAGAGKVICWQNESTPVKTITTNTGRVAQLHIRGDRLFVLAENGAISIIDLKNLELMVTVQLIEKDKQLRVAMVTPEGYYRVDPDLVNYFHFVKNGEVFPLSSFELQSNRPDKVFAALQNSDTAFLHKLTGIWRARVKKAGFDPDHLTVGEHRPKVDWNTDKLPIQTRDSVLQLQARITDEKRKLKSVLLRVNGVPEISMQGIKIGEANAGRFNYSLPLSVGENNISLIAMNEAGEESIEQTYTVFYQPTVAPKPNYYYIGVGVSDYEEMDKSLRYAAKDVRDIARYLDLSKRAIILDTLTNASATLQRIKAIKQKLLQTKPDDIVVLSFSGHGLISGNNGFFFAPYDMRFDKPEERGLSIATMEDLLDGIPARKKLLLLDACHSGEDIVVNKKEAMPNGIEVIRRGGVTESTDSVSAGASKNNQLLMQEMFGDMSRGNGSFVISAAAGNEYAMESGEWNNGVFTYSFLHNLKGRAVPVRDLRAAIYDAVNTLTNGQQTPASRRENGWWNWEF